MLEEALGVLRQLWQGSEQSHRGRHYTVDHARIYDVPDPLPPIYIAAAGPLAAALAGGIGDGLIAVGPSPEVVKAFRAAGGAGKPCYGQAHVCWAPTDADARRVAHEWWPTAAVPGELGQELPLPRHFEQASERVTEDDVAEVVVCGPDPEAHVAKLQELAEAGFDHVYVGQVGPDQEGFFRFYEREMLPRLRRKLYVAA
jgi:G6PDH family F420-dependent oxidoreductase